MQFFPGVHVPLGLPPARMKEKNSDGQSSDRRQPGDSEAGRDTAERRDQARRRQRIRRRAVMRGEQAAAIADPRRRMTLTAACLGMLTLGANGTAIMAALPTMRHELGLSAGQLEWVINAYLIVSAACIIPGGKFSDQVGARRVAMAGLALFAVASVVVATAQAPAVLLAGRALQGLAAALGVPGTLAAISEAGAPERRASAIGAWAGFLMLGFSLGPLIGGALTHYVDWRMIFWTSGVTMLAATSGFAVPGSAGAASDTRRLGQFDWVGFVLLAIFMTALVSALHALPAVMSAPLSFVGFGVLAAAAFVALLKAERRVQDPLIDLGLFKAATFVRAVALGSIAMSCILALLLFYNLDAQSPTGLSLTPVGAGLSLLPMSCGLLIFAFSAPSLIHRFGPRRALTGSNTVDCCSQHGDCRCGGSPDLGAPGARAVRHRRWLGLAICDGAAARAIDLVGHSCRRGIRHHQRLHVPWRQHWCGRRCGCLCPWRPASGDGPHHGIRTHRGLALPGIGGGYVSGAHARPNNATMFMAGMNWSRQMDALANLLRPFLN